MSSVIVQQNLESIADKLVPNKFRTEAPQYYQLVIAFLKNIQDIQDSINQGLMNFIDIDKINEDEIIQIYIDTYLQTLNISNADSAESLKDMTKISKELVSRKGTALLYNVLGKLLSYLFPLFETQYLILKQDLENATTDEEREEIQEQIDILEENSLDLGYIDVIEIEDESNPGYVVPFKYKVESNYSVDIFEKYIKPFCHPAGWEVDFAQVFKTFLEDIKLMYLRFTLTPIRYIPEVEAGGGYIAGNNDREYVLNSQEPVLLGIESEYDYYASKVVDVNKLLIQDGNLYYLEDGVRATKESQDWVIEGTSLPQKDDGTTDGSKYVRFNKGTQQFELIAGGAKINVGNDYCVVGGGAVAGYETAVYPRTYFDDVR